MKDGVYYFKKSLTFIEIYVFKSLDCVQIRTHTQLKYISKSNLKALKPSLKYLGEV